MRYRLMASYLGASYQAAVGPSDRDVTLFAAPPPPEEHGFSPAPGGIWRKQVRLDNLDALWESRPIGSYHGEPCLVLDDLGDRLHIVYLGMDERRAAQLGYWEVDRGVFEVVVPRIDVSDLAEERHEFPITLLLSALPRALDAAPAGTGRVIGAIGPGSPAGPVPAAAGAGIPMGGPGPGAMPGWNGPAGTAPVRGQLPQAGPTQLPAAGPQPLAAPGPQSPVSGAYPIPGAQNGMGVPVGYGGPGLQNLPGIPGMAPRADLPQFPTGQQVAGGQQAPAIAQGQGTQPSATGAASSPVPAMQFPSQPQLPTAQLSTVQPLGAQPLVPQPPAVQQFSPAPPLTAAPQASGAPQTSGPQRQITGSQPAGGAAPPGAQQQAGQQMPAQQSTGPQVAPSQAPLPQAPQAQVSQAQRPQTQAPQAPASAPTAVAAWHGSPAPTGNGNGNWYYQPGPDPQNSGAMAGGYAVNGTTQNGYPVNGTAQNGYPVNGTTQNGYAQPGHDTGPIPVLNDFAGMQQYAQPAQPASVTGYQQAPAAAQAPPGQATQLGQPAQAAQPGQPAPGPLPGQPSAQPAAPLAALRATSGVAGGTGEPGLPAGALGATQTLEARGLEALAPVAPQAATQAPPAPEPVAPQPTAQQALTQPRSAPPAPAPSQNAATGPLTSLPSMPVPPAPVAPTSLPPVSPSPTSLEPTAAPSQRPSHSSTAAGTLSKLSGAVRGRRAARKPRLAMSSIFADLVDMADIPRSAYAVDEEVTGAMCLFKTDGGYEVFSCAEDARHEVRFFEEEEAAYFYLFGVLAAEALRNGRLSPRRG